jgi:hypothetical protein
MRLIILFVGLMTVARAGEAPPDLTQQPKVDRSATYNLGATGLRGWIYTKAASHLDSIQGRTTTASRQILVTHVGVKSPADGVLQVDDVILGIDGKPFSDDARKSLARAIQRAEQEAQQGKLSLLRWRAGKTETATLTLPVLGTYSATAPYRCTKSERILAAATAALAKEKMPDNLWGAINGLALLATGKEEHLPQVRDFARRLASTAKVDPRAGLVTWEWGYRALFLGEYYLITRDQEILPALTQYTLALAKGQSMYGTFGHGIAELTEDGKLHGSIKPYGPVNEAGLIGNLAIVIGKKCGVKDPEIDAAITRMCGFFGYFVDKGTIPYGEHEPWPYHENNGKGSMTAVLFAHVGRLPEARFFARMSTAGYANREIGHTGQGFSYLWSALGAHVGGSAALAAFFKEASWHLDLVRRCDGTFTYDGAEQYGAGKTHDDTYYGNSSYYGLSPNATYVLTYALPLRKLCITGREVPAALALSPQEITQAISSGRFDVERAQKTPADLIAAFTDWSPVVRGWAAEELARRPEAKSLVPQLITLAGSTDAHQVQGACEALGLIPTAEALPVLVKNLAHTNRWVRYKAAQAIKRMGGAAKPVIPDLLTALVRTSEPLQPIAWDDPIQIAHGQLASAVFKGPLADQVSQADPKLLYPAIRAVAQNPDGMARATLRQLFENRLTVDDVIALAPELLSAVTTRCPADTMFGNEIRMGAFKALTKYNFVEGIAAGVTFAKTQGGHGSENRTGDIMKQIVRYGTAAKSAVPGLREVIVMFDEQVKRGDFPGGELNKRRTTAIEDAMRSIEAATEQPELRRIPAGR